MCLRVCTDSVMSDSLVPPGLYGALQAPLSVGFFQARTLQWVTISFSRNLLDPGVKPKSLASAAVASGFFITRP